MKYLSFESEEFKEFLNLRKGSILSNLIITIALTCVSYSLFKKILPANTDLGAIPITIAIVFSYLIIFVYSNKSYFYDLLKREKKVYRGVLSGKSYKERKGKYQFNVDGNIFIVDKEVYDSFEIGDIVDFHTSPKTKYLFKVEKVGESESSELIWG